jgi:hypothetical protein
MLMSSSNSAIVLELAEEFLLAFAAALCMRTA